MALDGVSEFVGVLVDSNVRYDQFERTLHDRLATTEGAKQQPPELWMLCLPNRTSPESCRDTIRYLHRRILLSSFAKASMA